MPPVPTVPDDVKAGNRCPPSSPSASRTTSTSMPSQACGACNLPPVAWDARSTCHFAGVVESCRATREKEGVTWVASTSVHMQKRFRAQSAPTQGPNLSAIRIDPLGQELGSTDRPLRLEYDMGRET